MSQVVGFNRLVLDLSYGTLNKTVAQLAAEFAGLLGLDVHDCAQARAELYLDGILEPGMVFTIEPGLYFQPDDLTVPAEFRGIGVRIEDDLIVTENGYENLTASLPRHPDEIERWMKTLL